MGSRTGITNGNLAITAFNTFANSQAAPGDDSRFIVEIPASTPIGTMSWILYGSYEDQTGTDADNWIPVNLFTEAAFSANPDGDQVANLLQAPFPHWRLQLLATSLTIDVIIWSQP